MKRKAIGKSMLLLLLAAIILLTACSGGGSKSSPSPTAAGQSPGASQEPAKEPPMKITFMVPAFSTELPDDDSIIIKKVEEYTGVDLEMQFVPNSSYADKVNATLVSGNMPTLMVVDRTPAFINAARAGAFWELGPYLKEYKNLSQANEIVLKNTSIDGKIYGIYRSRTLGRNGVSINIDWLENVGLEPPKTIEEFYNVLKAFKEQDPDRNGKDDTYGLVVSKYAGPWDIMQVWFGAPNKWGFDENGNLIPTHLTPEYREALKFFRKIYEEGLVNEDFAVMDPAVWNEPFVNGQAGVFVDVADNARRLDNAMQQKAPRDKPYVHVFQAPVGPKGHRDMPTSGYNQMIAVPKASVKTEAELRKVLDFLDKLNDVEMQLLLDRGIEGRHYNIVDGYIVPIESDDPGLKRERESLNQMAMFIGPKAPPLQMTEVNRMIEEVYAANEKIVVANPAEALISDVYAQKGQQLDNIINDARIQYIVGQIDDKGLDDAIELWRKQGGDELIEEMNRLYREANAN